MATISGGERRNQQNPLVATPNERLPSAFDYYDSVKILDNNTNPLEIKRKYGEGILHTLNVSVTRVYADEKKKKPRTSLYRARAAYRTDDNVQEGLPVVAHSDALFTTSEATGTATYQYFANPAKAGFPVINVGVKRHGGTLPIEEMADDKLAITDVIAEELGLGVDSDDDGVTEIAAGGYSRGIMLGIVAADRALRHRMRVDYIQGIAPGPHDKANRGELARRIFGKLPKDLGNVLDHLVHEPHHAIRNRLVFPLFSAVELAGYWGDAGALHTDGVGQAMTRISRDTRGHIVVFDDDSLGRPQEYSVDFQAAAEAGATPIRPFSDLQLIRLPGSHLSGVKRESVIFDRNAWQAEANRRATSSDTPYIS